MDEKMIYIPLDRYEKLLRIEMRSLLLADYTRKEKYSVGREKVAHYLGFELPLEDGE